MISQKEKVQEGETFVFADSLGQVCLIWTRSCLLDLTASELQAEKWARQACSFKILQLRCLLRGPVVPIRGSIHPGLQGSFAGREIPFGGEYHQGVNRRLLHVITSWLTGCPLCLERSNAKCVALRIP